MSSPTSANANLVSLGVGGRPLTEVVCYDNIMSTQRAIYLEHSRFRIGRCFTDANDNPIGPCEVGFPANWLPETIAEIRRKKVKKNDEDLKVEKDEKDEKEARNSKDERGEKYEIIWEIACYSSGFLTLNNAPKQLKGGDVVRLPRKVHLRIDAGDEVPYEIRIVFPESLAQTIEERVDRLNEASVNFAQRAHKEVLDRMRFGERELATATSESLNENLIVAVERLVEEVARSFEFFEDQTFEIVKFMAGFAVEDSIIAELLIDPNPDPDEGDAQVEDVFGDGIKGHSRFLTASPAFEKKLQTYAKQIAENKLDILLPENVKIPKYKKDEETEEAQRREVVLKRVVEFFSKKPKGIAPPVKPKDTQKKGDYEERYDAYLNAAFNAVEKGFWKEWFKYADATSTKDFLYYLALRYLKKTIKDTMYGYGPLEDLLRTPVITEIMVVDYKTIFIEKGGRLEKSGRRFFSEEITQDVINRIVTRVNRQIDKSRPLVDARLRDGSRVNAIIDPIAVSGACLTIRRFPKDRLTIRDQIEKGSLTEAAAEFLRASVYARKNVLVSGGTGTGKTTLLNGLGDFIPDGERIITIEDTVELQIKKRHVVQLEAKPANAEGKGAYTIRDLVKNALRMRPDRIIVGECRGGEALDMLLAMNTGHDGSLTTIHANSAADAILRLETLVLQSDAKLPVESIDRQIVTAIDLIVQLKRMRSGRRCVSQIVEVTHIDPETGNFVLRELFNLESDTDDNARLRATGSLPSYMHNLLAKGWLDLEKFYNV